MTTFAYTTGNPANLTSGANASMGDIQGPLNDLRTFLNSQGLDFTNIGAAVQSDYNTLLPAGGMVNFAAAGGSVLVVPFYGANQLATVGVATPQLERYAAYLDPADFALAGRAAKYRLRVRVDINSVAPGTGFTLALNSVTISVGSSGNSSFIQSLGAQLGAVTFAAPAAGFGGVQVGADFTAPAAGLYALGFTNPSAIAANSVISISALLQRRTV